jgi:hypothetical protein
MWDRVEESSLSMPRRAIALKSRKNLITINFVQNKTSRGLHTPLRYWVCNMDVKNLFSATSERV